MLRPSVYWLHSPNDQDCKTRTTEFENLETQEYYGVEIIQNKNRK